MIYAIDIDINIVAGFRPTSHRHRRGYAKVESRSRRSVHNERWRSVMKAAVLKRASALPDLDAVDIHVPGEIDAIVKVIFFQPPAESVPGPKV
mgnify:CR=1 FL=1